MKSLIHFPQIKTTRLVLRQHLDADTKAYFEIMSNPNILRYYGKSPLSSQYAAKKEIESIRSNFNSGVSIKWALILEEDSTYIGNIGASGLKLPHNRATLSIIIHSNFWGQGLAKEALNASIKYLFDEMKLHRLEVYVDPKNIRAVEVFKKIGFQKEGILRDYEFEQGNYIDIAIYSFIKQDNQ